jgi:hypothetical protein
MALKPLEMRKLERVLYYIYRDYLRPYKALFSLQIYLELLPKSVGYCI